MDEESDIKPFLSPVTTTPIQQGHHGSSTFQATALSLPLEHSSTPVSAGVQQLTQTQAVCVLNRAASELSDDSISDPISCPDDEALEGTSVLRLCPAPPPRFSMKFWSAGDYDAGGSSLSVPRQPQTVQNRKCVHPKFLHSNATSHKWPFAAVAELLDNAVDEIGTGGATRVLVDKVIDNRNGSPALLIQDDGGGMDPDSLMRCMSFGFSDKQSGSSIGQYGNGFKTSTMRLGPDVIVFSRSTKSGGPTQSIGLLSYTFLVETCQTDVVVPVVDYKCNLLTGQTARLERHGSEQFSSNLSVLLKWSPFTTEEELVQNFSDIGPHGTKIIVFNLWSNDDGNLELDFDTNPKDIMISGAPNPEDINSSVKRTNENHLANRLRYSLRAYASVLYLRLPDYFKIILRGQEIQRYSIAADLIYPECVNYKPQVYGRQEAEVLTTIGFLDGAPTISVHGFNIYHKNRLILPFHRVLSSANSKGRGIAGVLEVNYIKPTHHKQDFEKSQLFQRLMIRLKTMTNEYWDIHSHRIGYLNIPRMRSAPVAPAPPRILPIANGPSGSPEGSAPAPAVSVPPVSTFVNAVPIAFAVPIPFDAPPGFHSPPAFAPRAPPGYSLSNTQAMQVNQATLSSMAPGTDLVGTRKRKNDNTDLANEKRAQARSRKDNTAPAASFKKQATHDLAGSSSASRQGEQMDLSSLKLEARRLREQCSQFEKAEKELRLLEQNLRCDIERAKELYNSLGRV